MVWLNWRTAVLVVLALGMVALSQGSGQPAKSGAGNSEQFMTVHENGQSTRCRVVASWVLPNGSRAYQLQSLSSGEMLTIIEDGPPTQVPVPGKTARTKVSPMRIFHWSKGKAPPPGVPVPPREVVQEAAFAQPRLMETAQATIPRRAVQPGKAQETIIWWEEGKGSPTHPQGVIPANASLPWEQPASLTLQEPASQTKTALHQAPQNSRETGVVPAQQTSAGPPQLLNPQLVMETPPTAAPVSRPPLFPLLKKGPRIVATSAAADSVTSREMPIVVPGAGTAIDPVRSRPLYVPGKTTTAGTGTIVPQAGSRWTRTSGNRTDTIVVQSDPEAPAAQVMSTKVGGGFGSRVGPILPAFGSFGNRSHGVFARKSEEPNIVSPSSRPTLPQPTLAQPTLAQSPMPIWPRPAAKINTNPAASAGLLPKFPTRSHVYTPESPKPAAAPPQGVAPALASTQRPSVKPVQQAGFNDVRNSGSLQTAQGTSLPGASAMQTPTESIRTSPGQSAMVQDKQPSVFQRMWLNMKRPHDSQAAQSQAPAKSAPGRNAPPKTDNGSLQMAQGTPGLLPRTIHSNGANNASANGKPAVLRQPMAHVVEVADPNVGGQKTAPTKNTPTRVASAPKNNPQVAAAKPQVAAPKSTPAPAKEAPGLFTRLFGGKAPQTAPTSIAKNNAPGNVTTAQAKFPDAAPGKPSPATLHIPQGTSLPPREPTATFPILPASKAPSQVAQGTTGIQPKGIQAPPPHFPGTPPAPQKTAPGSSPRQVMTAQEKPTYLPDLTRPPAFPGPQPTPKPATPTQTAANQTPTNLPKTSTAKAPDLSKPPLFPGLQPTPKPATPTQTAANQTPTNLPKTTTAKAPDLSKPPLFPGLQPTPKPATPTQTAANQTPTNLPKTTTAKAPDLSKPPLFPGLQPTPKPATPTQTASNQTPTNLPKTSTAKAPDLSKPPLFPGLQPTPKPATPTQTAANQTLKSPTDLPRPPATTGKSNQKPNDIKTAAYKVPVAPRNSLDRSSDLPRPPAFAVAQGATNLQPKTIVQASSAQPASAKEPVLRPVQALAPTNQTKTAAATDLKAPPATDQASAAKAKAKQGLLPFLFNWPAPQATQTAQGPTNPLPRSIQQDPGAPKALPDSIQGLPRPPGSASALAKDDSARNRWLNPRPLRIPGDATASAQKTTPAKIGPPRTAQADPAKAEWLNPGNASKSNPAAAKSTDGNSFKGLFTKKPEPAQPKIAEPMPWDDKMTASVKANPFPIAPAGSAPSLPAGPPSTSVAQNKPKSEPGRLPFSTASNADSQNALPSSARQAPRTLAAFNPAPAPTDAKDNPPAKEPIRSLAQAPTPLKRDWRSMWGKPNQTGATPPGQSVLEQAAAKKTDAAAVAHANFNNLPASATNPNNDILLNPEKFNPVQKPLPREAGLLVYQKPPSPVQQTAAVAPATAPQPQAFAPSMPPGANSVMAARNGLLTPVTYVPVPVVTIPDPVRPPAPPQPKLPEAPQPAMYVNAFTPPAQPGAPNQQPNPAMNGPVNQRMPMYNPAMLAQMYAQNPFLANPAMLQQGIQQFAQLPPNQQTMIQQALFIQQQTVLMHQQALFIQQQQAMMQAQRPVLPVNYPANYSGPQPPNPFGVAPQQYQAPMPAHYMQPMGMMPQGTTPQVQQAAAQAPQTPAGQNLSVQQLIGVLMESPYPAQREWAANTLANFNWRNNPQVLHVLLQAARQDPAASVRAGCIYNLARMNAGTEPVMTTLQALQNDADPRVRQEVQQAFLRLAAPQGN